jgi:hypothetical protein
VIAVAVETPTSAATSETIRMRTGLSTGGISLGWVLVAGVEAVLRLGEERSSRDEGEQDGRGRELVHLVTSS